MWYYIWSLEQAKNNPSGFDQKRKGQVSGLKVQYSTTDQIFATYCSSKFSPWNTI